VLQSGAGLGAERLGRGGSGRLRLGLGRGGLTESASKFHEAVGSGGGGGAGTAKSEAIAARGAAVDEDLDVREKANGGVEEIVGLHGLEAADEGGHLFEEGLVFLERSAATAVRAVGGAELLAAFGDAAARAAVGQDVDAFFEHGFPPSKRKGSPRRAFCQERYFS